MGKITMGFEEQLKKVLDRLGQLEDKITTPAPEDADAKTQRIFDIIMSELNGIKAGTPVADGALRRGIRRALNEFFTVRNRSDTAFTADRVEINSAEARIRDLEVQLSSSLEIEKAARYEHARISEELVNYEKVDKAKAETINRLETTILQLQRELETKVAVIDNALLSLVDHGSGTVAVSSQVVTDFMNGAMPTQAELMQERMAEMDGPNYEEASE